MAGTGPAPKLKSQRRNAAVPTRGEWHVLAPLRSPVLPTLPKGEWSARTRAAWAAWRRDPATAMYGPADIQLALDLVYIYETWVRDETAALASEVRQRQDGLGLSPKGRQDRRWRIADAEEEPSVAPSPSLPRNVRRIRPVDPASVATG